MIKKLRIASCQFPISGNPHRNGTYIRKLIKRAAAQNADLIHFPEAALSGYPGNDMESFKNYDWRQLRSEVSAIQILAAELNIWVILGSSHYISAEEKPTNCLYVISNSGDITDRYDKAKLTPTESKWYTPGDHPVKLTLQGIACGFLICYDGSFLEMYDVYRRMGVKLMFHSCYNAGYRSKNLIDQIRPAQIRTRARDYNMWVIANNSSAKHSCWPTCIARPDGSFAHRLRKHVPGILYHDFPDLDIRGSTIIQGRSPWRAGHVHPHGKISRHPRARNRKALP